MMKHEGEGQAAVGARIEGYFGPLRRTVGKNLARLTRAFLRLALRVRFSYGGLHLTSVARGRQPFLIRARRKVIVQAEVRGRRQRLSLGRLPHRSGRATRYRHVLCQSQKAEPVDVIVYRERGFEQAWFLLVPPDSEA